MGNTTVDIIDMQARATEAGESVGKAHHRLRDLIRDMYDLDGITSYSGPEHKASRKAFAEAAEAGGTSKNSGMTLYARAYDSLIADGMPLEPRARKGAGGRKAAIQAASVPDAEVSESDDAPAPLSNEEAIAKARPFIAAESVRDFLAKSGVTYDVARDAALSYREAAERAETVHESACSLVRDLMGTVLQLGKALEGALKERDAMLESVGHDPIDYVQGASSSPDATAPASEPESEPAKPARKPRKAKAAKPAKAKPAPKARKPKAKREAVAATA